MAEAVEVATRRCGRATPAPTVCVQPLLQLARGLDVVGQDQDLLGQQVLARRQQLPDALDDDPRLARPGAGDDDDRPVAPLDDPALLGGEV